MSLPLTMGKKNVRNPLYSDEDIVNIGHDFVIFVVMHHATYRLQIDVTSCIN